MRKRLFFLLIFSNYILTENLPLAQKLKEQSSLERLFSPWRAQYRKNQKRNTSCPYCDQISENNDAQHYILKRFKHSLVMLNLYPYSAGGHLLIIPYQHTKCLNELSSACLQEIVLLIAHSEKILLATPPNEGINMGVNIGEAAAASIEHIHFHIVPRARRDGGFLPVISNTLPVPIDLPGLYLTLKPHFDAIVLQ